MKPLGERVLYMDNHLLAISKCPGEPVQDDISGDDSLYEKCKAWIKSEFDKPGEVYLGLVHRIDRPVSGLVLFARTSKAAARLSEMIQLRELDKRYRVIVENWQGEPNGTLENHLVKNATQNKSYVCEANRKGAKRAVLHYQVLRYLNHYTELEIKLETGRHHQIRTQLAHLGSPIRGDVKYGAKRPMPDLSIQLHAYSLQLIHPVKKTDWYLECPLPENWL